MQVSETEMICNTLFSDEIRPVMTDLLRVGLGDGGPETAVAGGARKVKMRFQRIGTNEISAGAAKFLIWDKVWVSVT